MKLLVTGGAGFMGSNFIRYQLANDPSVSIVNLDKLTYAGNLSNLKDVENNPRYKFVKGDIADEKLVNDLVATEKFDAIINYAAETHVDRSIMDPEAFLRTGVQGVYTLLEAVRKFSVPRFVQISTDEVYGAVLEGESDEQTKFEPRSPYSVAKAAGDLLCSSYVTTYQAPIIRTHSVNYYGPYAYPEKFIPLFITNLLEGKKVPIYGDGLQEREWIFTEDHCRAVDAVLRRGKLGEVYNIGTRQRFTNLEVAKDILYLLGLKEDCIEYVKDRAGHDRRYALNSDKLRRELGWEPRVEFADGLKQTIEWFKANETWWKPIKSGAYLDYYKQQYEKR